MISRLRPLSLVLAAATALAAAPVASGRAPSGPAERDVARADAGAFDWTQTAGPLGGTVTRLVTVNGKLWASLYSGGIYELSGNAWRQIAIGAGMPENRAMDVVVDPASPQTAYAAQMIACAAKTSDGGASWSGLCDQVLPAADSPNFNSHTLALDPEDPATVYLPGHRHDGTSVLLVSHDGGATWESRYTFPEHRDFNQLVFFGSRMLLGTREHGVLVSDDRGLTWTTLNEGLQGTETARFVQFEGALYLVGARLQFNTRQGGSLYRLNAAGTRWEKVAGPTLVTGAGTDGGTLWVGSEDNRLWRSSDGHAYARVVGEGLPPGWIGEIAASDSTVYLSSVGNGVFRSSNAGRTFHELNSGLTSIATREVHVNPKNPREIYVVTWDRLGMYVSRNAGRTYERVGTDYSIDTVAPDPRSFGRLYAAGDFFYAGRFTGSRVTWAELAKPGPRASIVKALAVSPKDANVVLAGVARETAETPGGYGLWYSTSGGRSWKRARGIPNNAVYSILFDPKGPSTVYASALGGGVYRSADSGRSFTRIGPPELKYTYRLAMSSRDPRHLVAGSNLFFAQFSPDDQISGEYGGLFETLDGGKTWTELTAAIRDYDGSSDPAGFQGWLYNFGHLVNYEQIVIDPRDERHILVGHHGESVVSTSDGGQTWQKQDAGMIPGRMHNYAYCLGASPSGSQVYACSCGRGLFRGVVSPRTGQIAWRPTQPGQTVGPAEDGGPQPRNAAEARALILSGAYTHPH